MRRMSVLLAGLVAVVLVAGCAPRYAYHQDTHHVHRVKGYYLADGTYVKVHPVHGTHKVHPGKGLYKVQKVGKKKHKK